MLSHRMGSAVEECGVLQRKVELLESQLEQLHNEYTTLQQTTSVSSSDSFSDRHRSSLSGTARLSLDVETPKVVLL